MIGWLRNLFGRQPPLAPPTKQDDELAAWCRSNWDRVPAKQRRACLDHLLAVVPSERIVVWCGQYERDEDIGSDEPNFHFSGGMAVRNELRKILRDDQLPAVVGPAGGYPRGELVRNWDDFYMGALEELCEEAQ